MLYHPFFVWRCLQGLSLEGISLHLKELRVAGGGASESQNETLGFQGLNGVVTEVHIRRLLKSEVR